LRGPAYLYKPLLAPIFIRWCVYLVNKRSSSLSVARFRFRPGLDTNHHETVLYAGEALEEREGGVRLAVS
jgi:hypothetical protein